MCTGLRRQLCDGWVGLQDCVEMGGGVMGSGKMGDGVMGGVAMGVGTISISVPSFERESGKYGVDRYWGGITQYKSVVVIC